jgi:AraC-like DNA-binding protein
MRCDAQPVTPLSEYREFPAPAALADRFLCFWTQTIVGSSGVYEHRVLPDACIDIVFVNDAEPVVVGPWDVAFVARLAAGTSITGVRMHPGRASCLLGMPAWELLNRAVPTLDVKGAVGGMRFEEVTEQTDASARRRVLARILSGSARDFGQVDQAVMAGIRWLSHHPQGRIRQLSSWIGIGERQLHRRFSAAVGYGPKTLHCVLRLQRLLKIARERSTALSLADLAAGAGYADQPHMTRDVHRLADVRPTALLRSAGSTLEMSDLFKT